MTDIVLEIIRASIVAIIFVLLYSSGKNKCIRDQQGWFFIVAGFGLILLGTVIDISDNFPTLNKYIIIGDTEYQAFIEKVVGYLCGFLLLAVGFWKWLPIVIRLKKTERALKEANNFLELKVKERTAQLEEEIQERKLAEAEKEKIEVNLRHAQKMEAVGTMAGGIAHNFNNILGSCIGYAEMAKGEITEGSSVYSDIEQVLIAAHRAKKLVQQIMIFSTQEDFPKEKFQPDILLHEALNSIKNSIPKNIIVDENISSVVGEINIDPFQFEKVVENISMNALDAMRDGEGVLEIILERIELKSEDILAESDVEPGDFVKLTISDTGHGIGSENMERIFDPFFTTKEVGKGDGIGLSVVHGIVRKSGGMIKAESEVGKGSRFHVFLPVVETVLGGDEPAS